MLFLALAVVAMFASEGRNLVDNPDVIYKLLIPVLFFFLLLLISLSVNFKAVELFVKQKYLSLLI